MKRPRKSYINMLFLKDSSLLRRQAYLDGQWLDAANGSTFDVLNPADGVLLAKVADCGAGETRLAIEAADRALPAWRAQTAAQRAALLRRWNDLILENVGDLALLMSLAQGKPLAGYRDAGS